MQCLLCLLLPALAVASKVNVAHPIQGVMAKIQQLDKKAVALGKEEAASFEEYEAFMEKEKATFSKAIEGFKADIEEGDSTLKALKANKEALEEKKEAVEKRLAKQASAKADAVADRKDAVALFSTKLTDINATMQALSDGMASLEDVKTKPAAGSKTNVGLLLLRTASTVAKSLISQHASLLEVASKDDEATLLELAAASDLELASASEGQNFTVPTKAPVKSHTGSVIDLLKKLLLSYEDQHKKTTMEALQAKGEFDLAQASRVEAISLSEDSKKKGEASLADVNAKISSAQTDLAAAEKDLETNSKSLQDTEIELKIKSDEFKERAYMRNKEREAFKYGLQVLAKVSGLRAPVSLVQLQSGPKIEVVQKKLRAINLLHEAAQLSKSRELHRLASELEHGTAPIAQVAKNVDLTIFSQISKINADQFDDDKKRFWCEEEVNKTEIEKKFKGEELKETKDKIEVAEAGIATLEEALEKATKALTEAKKDMHEEVMLREKAKNENKITVKDAQESQEALKVAMKTIKEYYEDAKSFIQVDSHLHAKARREAPSPGWSKAGYEGVSEGEGSPGAVILKLLESTQTEYATMEATTNAEEADQAAEHENKMKDWKAILAESETEIDLKTQERFRLAEKLKGFTESAKLTDRQAASLANYLEDVTTDCYGGNSTFKTRAAERAAEIASLNSSRATLAVAFNVSNATSLLQAASTAHFAKHRSHAAFLAPSP